MSTPNPLPSSPTPLDLGEVYHILFRRKFTVLGCLAAGLLAAFGWHHFHPLPFESEAKLFIRYVAESRVPAAAAIAKSPDQRGETILDSEMEIIRSYDLARAVAREVGPATILGPGLREPDLDQAATALTRALRVDSPPRSSVIRLTFAHVDPVVARRVLEEVIAGYLRTHVTVHRAGGTVGHFLSQEAAQLRARLAQTEEQLRQTRNRAGVVSLEETKTAQAAQLAALRQQVFATQAELAERRATLDELRRREGLERVPAAADPGPAFAALDDYRRAVVRLGQLRVREQELLGHFRDGHEWVLEVRRQIAEAETVRTALEARYPALRPESVTAPAATVPAFDAATEAVRIAALEAKLRTLEVQLGQVRADAAVVEELETSLVELRRRQQLEEASYRQYATSLEQARLEEALAAGRLSNISQIQAPTAGRREPGAALKWLLLLGGGGLVTGLCWAFVSELYLDRTVKRPADIERVLQPSLLLSVPRLANGHRPSLRSAASRDGCPALAPFHDTLRDQVVARLEAGDPAAEPKLIGVSGLGRGAGVSTTAIGLARSLAGIGDCDVLLVDLTLGHESAREVAQGGAACDLERALAARADAMVGPNLFLAAEDHDLPRTLPQRLARLQPRLKAGDFDYLVFDLPPVSPTSVTPQLAHLMDLNLLVVEAEATEQEVLERAVRLLAAGPAPVGIVLNQARSYVPGWLKRDFSLEA